MKIVLVVIMAMMATSSFARVEEGEYCKHNEDMRIYQESGKTVIYTCNRTTWSFERKVVESKQVAPSAQLEEVSDF